MGWGGLPSRGSGPPLGAAVTLTLLLALPMGATPVAAVTAGGSIAEYTLPAGGGSGFDVTSGPDGKVWFATGRGAAGRIDPRNTSDIAEYFLPGRLSTNAPQARGITAGVDGNLWVTEGPANLLAQVPTSGGPIQEFAPSPCLAQDQGAKFCVTYIASDGAGNLWFTEFIKNRIGRLNPARSDPHDH